MLPVRIELDHGEERGEAPDDRRPDIGDEVEEKGEEPPYEGEVETDERKGRPDQPSRSRLITTVTPSVTRERLRVGFGTGCVCFRDPAPDRFG